MGSKFKTEWQSELRTQEREASAAGHCLDLELCKCPADDGLQLYPEETDSGWRDCARLG